MPRLPFMIMQTSVTAAVLLLLLLLLLLLPALHAWHDGKRQCKSHQSKLEQNLS
jgi:fumarate reductase subunit D